MSNLELKVAKKVDEESIKDIVGEQKVSDEKIEKSLNYEALSAEEKQAIEEFNQKIDVTDSTQVLQYGVAAQEKISKFSDSILEDVKTKNAGDTGELLADLVSQIKSFDSDIANNNKKRLFSKLFHNVKRELNYIVAKYNKIDRLLCIQRVPQSFMGRVAKERAGHSGNGI